MVDALEVADVLEHEGVVHGDLPPDLLVHGIDERLVDGHALLGQRRRVVDRDLVELRVRSPVFVEDEEQLLRPAQGEDWDEAAAAPGVRTKETFEMWTRSWGVRVKVC